MRTDELIVELARAAGPVRPLPAPSWRLARWTAATVPLMILGVFLIGPRPDVLTVMPQPAFLAIAFATFSTGLLAAACALVLSVPGAERSVVQRILPLAFGGIWLILLVVLLTTGAEPIRRLLEWPLHWACVLQIVGLSAVPGWALFTMVGSAAPLRRAWSGALAALGAVAIGAAATQFICPLDDPAHQLAGHALPVAIVSVLGAFAGHRYFNWLTRGLDQ